MKPKMWFVASTLGVSCVALGGVAGALLAPTSISKPEIDRASATIQLGGQLKSVTCNGEDKLASGAKTPYITYLGSWHGLGESGPPGPDRLQPVGHADCERHLVDDQLEHRPWRPHGEGGPGPPPRTGTTYSGHPHRDHAGRPDSIAGTVTTGRGWIVANFKLPDDGVTGANDDYLYANVEFSSIGTTGGHRSLR